MSEEVEQWYDCVGCDGSGKVKRPRLFVSGATGDRSTAMSWGRCPHCRENPGRQRYPGRPV
ncbi:hypothetical protein IQ251_06805 [Saccharopolyspora sp. HNM0983]|uniref:Uncharacterized protein n=1 Tax=Saccharopolyspora montiporae TaxID=2781240 RepID=A0A929B9Y7_9PSEU|nr:hypothetical protein [Saccharopolyspora sp. HNM0983]MBE9374156.1 hypothetical protein [Saccharopolyspora sp. HNM0983]